MAFVQEEWWENDSKWYYDSITYHSITTKKTLYALYSVTESLTVHSE